MKTAFLLATGLALAVPAVLAQEAHVSADAMNNHRESGWTNHQAWLNTMDGAKKIRAMLAEGWQGMGLSPQAAKMLAEAYDPERAARLPHVSLRGKSAADIAQLMQQALKEKRYLYADQLLIDYQRQRVKGDD